jgi:ribosome biogenesis GTPase
MYPDFATYAAQGLVPARVILSHRDQYRLAAEQQELSAEPSGALWFRTPDPSAMPVVGDWVAARMVAPGQAIIEHVLPRRTIFARRAAGRLASRQPIAANIDVVFLVSGLDGDHNLRRLERYLALAAESGAQPVIVLHKSDLCPDLPARIAEAQAVSAGAPVVATTTQAAAGLDALRAFLRPGRTIALLGSSGAGKSSIVNALLGESRQRTGEVRESDSRGRHTTTHRELIPLPGGAALIDTPGMRELGLWASPDSVDAAFDDIATLSAACRYRDCTHASEPACAVRAAVDAGNLAADRLASYHKLQNEARWHETLTDPLAALERKRKWKAIHRAARR